MGRSANLFMGMVLVIVLIVASTVVYGLRTASNIKGPSFPSLALPTAGPTATPVIVTSGTVIRQMQSVQRLETTRYTIETVVDASTEGTFFSSGERLLLIAHGTVVAGFDLARLTTADVIVSADGKTVTVTLPPVEFFSTSLDEGKTRIYSRESGKQLAVIPKEADPNLETAARRRGLEQIVQAACDDGIVKRATEDGIGALRDLLTIAGFTTVQVRVEEPTRSLCSTPSTARRR